MEGERTSEGGGRGKVRREGGVHVYRVRRGFLRILMVCRSQKQCYHDTQHCHSHHPVRTLQFIHCTPFGMCVVTVCLQP